MKRIIVTMLTVSLAAMTLHTNCAQDFAHLVAHMAGSGKYLINSPFHPTYMFLMDSYRVKNRQFRYVLTDQPVATNKSFAYTPDRAHYVSSDRSYASSALSLVCVYNRATGKCEQTLAGHELPLSCLALTPSGNRCVSGSLDCTARVWNLSNGICERVLVGHVGRINCLAIARDGNHCVSVSSDFTARIWNLATGDCKRVLVGHGDRINCVAITPDGAYCITGSDDETARVWNLETGKCVKVLDGIPGRIEDLAITADGSRCITESRTPQQLFRVGSDWNFGLPAPLHDALSSLSIAQVALLGDIANLQKGCQNGFVRRIAINKHDNDSYNAYCTLPWGIKELISPYIYIDNQGVIRKFVKNVVRRISGMVDSHPYLAAAAVSGLIAALSALR